MVRAIRPTDMNGLSILVAEDDSVMDMLVEAILRDMGVTDITIVRDGANALRLFRNHPNRYDCIISDWEMPNVSGIELLQQVRRLRPNLPFLMLTVRSKSEAILAAKNANVTAYISKPFMPQVLQTKLTAIIESIYAKKHEGSNSAKKDFLSDNENVFFVC